jgi:hypothetical protein
VFHRRVWPVERHDGSDDAVDFLGAFCLSGLILSARSTRTWMSLSVQPEIFGTEEDLI